MKTNRNYSFIVFIVLCFSIKAQNLVPNYSFEQVTKCTNSWGEFIGYVADWNGQVAGSGLSYYTHQCPGDSAGGGSVPYNFYYGFQYAHTGVSYAEVQTFVAGSTTDTTYPYGNNMCCANERNYLDVKLTDSLQTGIKYFVTFFVNLQNSCNYACHDIGVYFSDSAPSFNGNGTVLSYIPQVANNPKKQELTDTLNWMKIAGRFIAVGGEKYITIGNFKNDSLSSIRYLGQISPNTTEAWYYVDDVIVSPDSNYADSLFSSINELRITNYGVKMYPIPATNELTVDMQLQPGHEYELDIYNTLGEKVVTKELKNELTTLQTNNLITGIYLYRIIDKAGNLIKADKLIIER